MEQKWIKRDQSGDKMGQNGQNGTNKGKIYLEYDKNFEVQLCHAQFFLGKVCKLQQKENHNI